MRIKGIIRYDGTSFFGFQKQPQVPTIQGEIEKILKKLDIFSSILYGGRTDKGVHGLNQVIAFDVPSYWGTNLEKLKSLLNYHLHPSIDFKKLVQVPSNFHPSYWAIKRSYRYLFNYRFSPFNANYTLSLSFNLPVEFLNQTAKLLEGVHDFRYFAKTGTPVSHYRRKIFKARFYSTSFGAVFQIEGSGFLRGQVRLIVGFLLEIAQGNLTSIQLRNQLEGKKVYYRTPAPPNGLYLHRIWYKF